MMIYIIWKWFWKNLEMHFFPTCQVRVVRVYVSLFLHRLLLRLFLLLVVLLVPRLRPCECSVACRTATAILWVQCGVPDLNRDRASGVWRAGPQPRWCVVSVACRTSTAIMGGQCGVPDRNRERVKICWFQDALSTSLMAWRRSKNLPGCWIGFASSVLSWNYR